MLNAAVANLFDAVVLKKILLIAQQQIYVAALLQVSIHLWEVLKFFQIQK